MRLHSLAFTTVTLLLTFGPIAFAEYTPKIQVLPAGDGIYVFSSGSDGYVSQENSIAVVNENDVLIYDANTRPSTTQAVLIELRKITRKPVRWVVNSHWHPDHWSGNEVYAREFPGVQIIATEETAEFMHNIAPAWAPVFEGQLKRMQQTVADAVRTGKNPDGTVYSAEDRTGDDRTIEEYASFVDETSKLKRVYPNLLYRNRMTFTSGGREFQLLSLSGDATYSTVLYLPKEKVLLVGDLLVHPTQWGSKSDALSPWIASLRQLSALEVNTIVPGHGPVFRDKQYLGLVLELFETIRSQVRAALQSGMVELKEVEKVVKLDDLKRKFAAAGAEFMNIAVRMAYREARDGMDSTR